MNTDTDIVVIGAGPVGLAFCRSMADSGLRLSVIEKSDAQTLENPPADGREIALTHVSKSTLTDLGAWDYLPETDKYFLREAKVINGTSPYTLHFPTPDKCATVLLSTGEKLTAQLVVAADSRFSNTRRQMGIATEMHDFGRTVIVFRMQHTLSNENTATECFHYGRTLAVLPLTEHLSSMVITIDSALAEKVWQMDAEQTRLDIIEQLDGKLGDMQLAGKKHRYPLVGVHARKFYAKRYVLIGDAAVGMHPVTAHGFNLGLQSQGILSNLIKSAVRHHGDIAATELLAKYSRRHMLHTLPLYHGTNAIVKLFTTENPPAKALRHAALHAGNLFLPFKQLVSRQLTG